MSLLIVLREPSGEYRHDCTNSKEHMKNLLLTFLLVTSGYTAFACSCDYPTEISKAYKASSYIVHGRVVDLHSIKVSESMDDRNLAIYKEQGLTKIQTEMLETEFLIAAKLHIITVLKGTVQNDTIVIYTTRTAASCGFTKFQIEQEFIIYGSQSSYFFDVFYSTAKNNMLERENSLWVTSCSLTAKADENHFTKIKEISDREVVTKIATAAFDILEDNGLLTENEDVRTSIQLRSEALQFKEIAFEDRGSMICADPQKAKLILRVISVNQNSAKVLFKSLDHGGRTNEGQIVFKKQRSVWLLQTINYVTAID